MEEDLLGNNNFHKQHSGFRKQGASQDDLKCIVATYTAFKHRQVLWCTEIVFPL